jgi:putative redox protein
MAVRIFGTYAGQQSCQATHEPSGTELATDAPLDNGGRGLSYSPTDLVATALGTCVMTIMGLIAERHEVDLTGMTFEVHKEMIQKPVRRIGSLKTVITIPTGACDDAAMRKRIETGALHCPVHQSIHPEIDAPIEFRWL